MNIFLAISSNYQKEKKDLSQSRFKYLKLINVAISYHYIIWFNEEYERTKPISREIKDNSNCKDVKESLRIWAC